MNPLNSKMKAVACIIDALPPRFRTSLHAYLQDCSGFTLESQEPLFTGLRRALNICAEQGLLDRRAFLRLATLMSTSGLLPLIFPNTAQGAGFFNTGAFIKKRITVLEASAYPAKTGNDPYWDYVTLLMNFDTPTPSTGFTTIFADESNVGKTPTIGGSPQVDTSAGSSPYAGRTGSAKFNGSSDYLTFANSADYQFGNGNFTVEFWVKFSAWAPVFNPLIGFDQFSGGTSRGWALAYSPTANSIKVVASFDGSTDNLQTFAWEPSLSTWYHLALVRNGSALTVFVNGSSIGAYSIGSNTLFASASTLKIGYNDSSTYHTGSIADLRIYKGVAIYTSNFNTNAKITAPASVGLGTANDRYWGYCVLACPFEISLKDMSGQTFATNGSPSLSSNVKKYGTASLSVSSQSYLQLRDTTPFNLGAGNLTVEAWIYLTGGLGAHQFIACGDSGAVSSAWQFTVTSANKLGAAAFGGFNLSGATTLAVGQWYHVAWVRSGSTVHLFLNGQVEAIGSSSETLVSGTFARIGSYSSGAYGFNGCIDSLRITKGYARYTSNFTPPTASFPVGKDETVDPFWSYTVLAMHMDDLTDSTGRHTVTANNSASISTSVKRYGTGSVSLNGSNQYLTSADSADFAYGASDFTEEFWFYLNSLPTWSFLRSKRSGSYDDWSAVVNSAGAILVYATSNGSSWDLLSGVSGGNCIAASWNHFAITRQAGVFRIFLNGVQTYASASSASALWTNTGSIAYGIVPSTTNPMNGYLDDLRITKGIARYTQNFTPSTRAFATGTVFSNTQTFSYTGSNQTFTVPAGVTALNVKLWGGGGASSAYGYSNGGGGGAAFAILAVTPGTQFTVLVGGGGGYGDTSNSGIGGSGGFGGGAAGGAAPATDGGRPGGGGGGRTQIATSGGTILLIAGGGGGGGYGSGNAASGGAGGGTSAEAGAGSGAGAGGTQSTGGSSNTGTAGESHTGSYWGAGGGGGGYYGGIGGTSAGGGGGGSGYAHPSLATNVILSAGNRTSPGGSSDIDYSPGVGTGGVAAAGSAGRVLIKW